jgi:hypothetical protein
MGALFRAPRPPAAGPAPQPSPMPAPDAAASDARAEALARSRRGLAGTIATSARGVLAPALPVAARKTLLGE